METHEQTLNPEAWSQVQLTNSLKQKKKNAREVQIFVVMSHRGLKWFVTQLYYEIINMV